ncbi:MAG: response regulator, partial [Deltaproteobacteria bacterium]
IYWRGEPLRVLSLAALTGAPQAHHARRVPAVVVGHGERNCALLVDRLVGREEGIVKPLGPLLEPLGLYAGAVVGGEGRVRLVLDAAWLLTASMGRPRPRRPLGPAESQRPRILLVDDSLSVRTHLSRILRSNGWEVRVAADGRAALEQALTNSFDLVLTDLEMPRMHGFDLMERLRAEPRYAGIPIVVLSSRAGRKHRERARQLGAADFLAKPVNRDVLLARLRAQLSHSRSK